MKIAIMILLTWTVRSGQTQQFPEKKHVEKNGIEIIWYFAGERIFFELSAKTKGWVALGFDDDHDIAGSYLIMACVKESQVVVQEHFVIENGIYPSFDSQGKTNSTMNIEGIENDRTTIRFSLPKKKKCNWAMDLLPGNEYVLHLAYSMEGDFNHHSIERNSINVKL